MVTEKELRSQVITLANLYGYKTYFTWTSIHSPRGMPDLILSKKLDDGNTVILFVELKRKGGKLSEEQKEWLGLLSAVPSCFCFVWDETCFDDIVEIVQATSVRRLRALWRRLLPFMATTYDLDLSAGECV